MDFQCFIYYGKKYTAGKQRCTVYAVCCCVGVIKDSYFIVKPAGAGLAFITERLSFLPNDL